MSPDARRIGKLILVPAVITLAVTPLRLVGELLGWSRLDGLQLVWGCGRDSYQHTVSSHVNRLRAKIEKDPSDPASILTAWGVGYRFRDRKEATGRGEP